MQIKKKNTDKEITRKQGDWDIFGNQELVSKETGNIKLKPQCEKTCKPENLDMKKAEYPEKPVHEKSTRKPGYMKPGFKETWIYETWMQGNLDTRKP